MKHVLMAIATLALLLSLLGQSAALASASSAADCCDEAMMHATMAAGDGMAMDCHEDRDCPPGGLCCGDMGTAPGAVALFGTAATANPTAQAMPVIGKSMPLVGMTLALNAPPPIA